MPSSSMVSATNAAPNRRAKRQIASSFSSPSSRLIELMMHLPPQSLRAASMTGTSVLSIIRGR
jgi:hypothetical protein